MFSIFFNNHNVQLLCCIPLALLLLLFRYFLQKYVLTPIAFYLGIKPSSSSLKNPILEYVYDSTKVWNQKLILRLSRKLGTTDREVETWLRIRKGSKRKSRKLEKFCENSWRLLYYTFSFSYGIIIMWDKPWLWDINRCWDNINNQIITRDVWWYYIYPLSFYLSVMISQFYDVKRRDFWEMFLHHIITIALMTLSWIFTFFRIGSLVLLVHDFADIFLEASKVTHYSKLYKLRNIFFVLFAISWMVTRVGIYPLWIIWSALTVDFEYSNTAYYMFNFLLVLLFSLHCFWTCLLFKFITNSFIPGKMKKDIRSSSESEDESKTQ